MTALYVAGGLVAAAGTAILAAVLATVRSVRHGRYLGPSGPDDNYTATPATPVRAPLAIEAATHRPAAELARIPAATELPRFPFPKGGPRP